MYQRFDIHSRIIMRSGVVFYGAKDKLLGKDVWLWRLFEFHDASPAAAELIAREKAPLRQLKHPGLVAVHDVEADSDGVVAILEPAAGEPLDEVIARGPLSTEEFVPLAEAVLAAFAHAAGQGIVHGAMEPGMVFLNRKDDGEIAVKILGFGISRLMARLRGGEFDGSEAADLRQLGLLFHGLLAGAQPDDPPAPLPEKAPAVPEKIAAWVMRFFADDEGERPAAAASALDQLRIATAPPPPEMQPSPWPTGYAPHPPMLPPGWMPPPGMWAAQQPMPVMTWPPHDPQLMQPQPMWQPPMMHPWPQPLPMMQPPAPAATDAPPPASEPPKPSGPIAKPPSPPARPSGPLPASPKTGALKDGKATGKKSRPPKASAKKWIGPAIALTATCITLWFMRGLFSPLFRSETWRGMFGNIEIRIGDGKPAPQETKAAGAGKSEPSTAGKAATPAAATAAATQPAASPAASPSKTAAKPKAPPTGPIFARQFDDPYKKGRTSEFKPAGATIAVADAPSTWPAGGKTAQVTATAKYASLRASLPRDSRLALKPGQGIRLQFDVHFTAPLPPMERGFRFGIFSRKNIGCFCSVPAGAPGEMKIFANNGKEADLAGGKDAVPLSSASKAAHPGLAAGQVIRCSLTLQPQPGGALKIEATAADAVCTALADPKIHPVDLNFTSGTLVLRNTDQLASFHFDGVRIEPVK